MTIIKFPPLELADENGLLAIGGDLDIASLELAYKSGIFPWPISEEYPLAWFSPDPRGVLHYENLHIGRSLKKVLKDCPYDIRFNTNFEKVILACASVPRKNQDTTWITREVVHAYIDLFRHKKAYSVEAYDGDDLVGGVYGVCIEGIISGESMFHFAPNASKVCLVYLMELLHERGINWIDTQMVTGIIAYLGGAEIPRKAYLEWLRQRHQLSYQEIFK